MPDTNKNQNFNFCLHFQRLFSIIWCIPIRFFCLFGIIFFFAHKKTKNSTRTPDTRFVFCDARIWCIGQISKNHCEIVCPFGYFVFLLLARVFCLARFALFFSSYIPPPPRLEILKKSMLIFDLLFVRVWLA